jgi:hypothetical protein
VAVGQYRGGHRAVGYQAVTGCVHRE